MAKTDFDMDLNDNQIIVFRNNHKKNEKSPDYAGEAKDENGVYYRVSLWIRTSKKGTNYFSGLFSPKTIQPLPNPDVSSPDLLKPAVDQEIPDPFGIVDDVKKEVDKAVDGLDELPF